MKLDPDDVEAIARRVAELVQPPRARLVGVDELARELSVHPEWVYRNARALGGAKLGVSANSPWRFDLERAREAAISLGGHVAEPPARSPRGGRPRRSELPPEAALLAGRSARAGQLPRP